MIRGCAHGLAETVRELGRPLIPLQCGVLLVPLIGAIDSARSMHILGQVLEGISRDQAEHVLLDITGVPTVDTQVAASLMQIALDGWQHRSAGS